MTRPQHDHHCLLVVNHRVWRITGVARPFVALACPCCGSPVSADMTRMDFETYCDARVMDDYAEAAGVSAPGTGWAN